MDHDAGVRTDGQGRRADVIRVISPHTEQPVAEVDAATPSDVDAAVGGPSHRIAAIRRLADIYDRRRAEMADTITAEIGAPISFARRAQVGLPAFMIRAFCDLAERHPWQETRPGFFGSDVYVRREPVGVVAAIVPWNMPQFLIVTKLIPALLAGCTVVLKPAPESPLDALLLAEMISEADLPPGAVSVLPGDAALGAYLAGGQGVLHRLRLPGAPSPRPARPTSPRSVWNWAASPPHWCSTMRRRTRWPPGCARPACPTAARSACADPGAGSPSAP